MFKSPTVDELYAEVVGAIYMLCAKTPNIECNCLPIIKSIKETYLDV
jgi:hypothetical protein